MVTFQTLWLNFPNKDRVKKDCTNKQAQSNKPFKNYCAILLSECFIRSGIDTNTFSGDKCWSHAGKRHVLRAEDLASSLKKQAPSGFKEAVKVSSGSFQDDLDGKTGVIFFKDYWQRGQETFESRSGDHIDLWNKDGITGHGMTTRSIYEFFGLVSDLNKSREVWFWEVL